MKNHVIKFFPILIGFLGILACVGGCSGLGGISFGGGGSLNESVPSNAQLISQGQFFGQNGQTVSGSASIYLSAGSYLLHLQGLSVSNETGLYIQALTSVGQIDGNITLRSSTGSQNYSVSSPNPRTYTSVNIISTITNPPQVYAQALLAQP